MRVVLNGHRFGCCTGEAPRCPVYIDGKRDVTLEGTYEELAAAFQALVDNYIASRYARKTVEVAP